MSTASKKSDVEAAKEHSAWKDQNMRQVALDRSVGLVRGAYEPKNIVKDAQVFYEFLKGKPTK